MHKMTIVKGNESVTVESPTAYGCWILALASLIRDTGSVAENERMANRLKAMDGTGIIADDQYANGITEKKI
jgi:hypothetical protein